MKSIKLPNYCDDQLINLALDTINKNKQALVFCNTKRGAEAQAERIAKKVNKIINNIARNEFLNKSKLLEKLSEKILGAVNTPTKQCKRLVTCVKKGIAFHHAGLNSKQRDIIEEGFRNNDIFIICSTPTLAMGLDLPAFRSVIKDTKRFSMGKSWGMNNIPVLEYEQMIGRAGRPGKEDFGEAIIVANNDKDANDFRETYINGSPEDIHSKLAVEPVLRTYLLSLIATGFIKDPYTMFNFFDDTFYAKQYGDLKKLHDILNKMLFLLEKWDFIEKIMKKNNFNEEISNLEKKKNNENEERVYKKNKKSLLFQTASDLIKPKLNNKNSKNNENNSKNNKNNKNDYESKKNNKESFRATLLGNRVAQLYIDPYTANFLIKHLKKINNKKSISDFAILHLLTSTIELRPLLNPKQKDYELIDEKLIEEDLLVPEPNNFNYDYEDFLSAVKSAMFLEDWINEINEEELFEKYGIRPGEIQAKKERADWLLYSCEELSKLLNIKELLNPLSKLRIRLEYGVKNDLLNLLRLKNIGKVRARTLYKNNIKGIGDIKNANFSTLIKLIGPKTAANLKEQVGEKVDPEKIKVKKNKRKGQKSLNDY